ncbi:MAG: hypothetical protein WC867_01735 [Candidatus Pacearchaeota archaeon]
MSSITTAPDLKENFSLTSSVKPTRELFTRGLEVLDSDEVESDKIKKYLKEERGITLDQDMKYIDKDILAVFPGATIIRRSEIIPEMRGYRLGICKYSISCRDYVRDSYYCAYNNYNRLDEKGKLGCYFRIENLGKLGAKKSNTEQ